MKPVYLASPFRATESRGVKQHIAYARRAMHHCLLNDEAPFPSHMLYPQILNDEDPEQRQIGHAAGLSWMGRAEALVVYADYGVSPGMQAEIVLATQLRIPVEFRYILTRKAPQRSSIPK